MRILVFLLMLIEIHGLKYFGSLFKVSFLKGFPKKTDDTESTENIVGGTSAYHGEFPYQLIFLYKNRFRCGGFILNKFYAATAAHCPVLNNLEDFKVVAGEFVLSKNDSTEQIRNVVAVIKHNFSHASLENDLALLKVDPPFDFNKYVGPVQLPTQGSSHHRELRCDRMGQTSVSWTPTRYSSEDSMICAGYSEGGKGACHGDSGGPLFCNGYVAGIVSFGRGCAFPNYPTVFTETAFFVDWIKKHIN
ncbi:Chymotrypsin-1 [Armadillidium nasatum]|uniref:Chymotrypsin-1 n=1 Tax=Armadillidium nasatum TaxID=96803 RepID=A0A5N5TBY1_9CRUS|nr:Chymotrypsin-1 [Armadillidium nasatum]